MPEQPAIAGPYLFLSYASADRARALALANWLEAAGMHVWLDRTAVAGGTSWGREIVEGIKSWAALLNLCTYAVLGSRNVRQEIQLAWRYERWYVPLLLKRVQFPAGGGHEQTAVQFDSAIAVYRRIGTHERWLARMPAHEQRT